MDREARAMVLRGLIAHIVTVSGVLCLFAASGPVAAQSNSLMMQWGKDALDTCSHIEERPNRDFTKGMVCLSWVNGATQASSHTVSFNPDKPDYCTPKVGGSTGQYAAVFLKFLRDNPGKRHLPAIWLYHQAMAESFPCPQ